MFEITKTVYLLQSPSGGGKTTLSNKIIDFSREQQISCGVCSADNYFMNNGKYEFDASKLYLAHSYCKYQFEEFVKSKLSYIVVDNTNTDLKSIRH